MKAWMLPLAALPLLLAGCAGGGSEMMEVRGTPRADLLGTIQDISEQRPDMPGLKDDMEENGQRGRDWLTVNGSGGSYSSAIVTVDHETQVFRNVDGVIEPVPFQSKPDQEPYSQGQTVEITFEPGSVVEASPVRARAEKLVIVQG